MNFSHRKIQRDMDKTVYKGLDFTGKHKRAVLDKMHKKRQFIGYKLFHTVLSITVLLGLFVSSYHFVNNKAPTDFSTSSHNETGQTITHIDGQVKFINKRVYLYLYTTLPEGSVIKFSMNHKAFEDKNIVVGENGYVSTLFPFDRHGLEGKIDISITFKPDKQEPWIQSMYGTRGEELVGAQTFEYEKNGKTYHGIKAKTFYTKRFKGKHGHTYTEKYVGNLKREFDWYGVN